MSSKHPLGVHGMKQSFRSPLASFPALMLVNLKPSCQNKEEGRLCSLETNGVSRGVVNKPMGSTYPSTSLSGVIALMTASVLMGFSESKGSCTMKPCTVESSFKEMTYFNT